MSTELCEQLEQLAVGELEHLADCAETNGVNECMINCMRELLDSLQSIRTLKAYAAK